ncbi:MAG TPA: hypothetical protein ENH15_00045 [Actinobacteria bacterium]|nr:hypothetical protein [Actinomycetota bacterium]
MQTRSSGGAPILAFFGLVALWGCTTESVQGPVESQFAEVSVSWFGVQVESFTQFLCEGPTALVMA